MGIARERICLVQRGLAQFEADAFAVLIIYGERRKEFKHSNGDFHHSPFDLSLRHTLPFFKNTRS